MKSLHLSEALYLKNFDSAIKGCCNGDLKPLFLVEIGCEDGYLLKRAYEACPVTVVALVDQELALDEVRRKFADIPHHVIQIKDQKTKTIQDALLQHGINDLSKILFLSAFAKTSDASNIQEWSSLLSPFGCIYLQIHNRPVKEFLLEAAYYGWFSSAGLSFRYPGIPADPYITLNHFELRPYRIRQATQDDLASLMELERLCWEEGIVLSEKQVQERIKQYAEGQLVLEDNEGICGAIFSQRIKNIDDLFSVNFCTASSLLDIKGPIVHVLSLDIHPLKRRCSFGGQLLEFFMQLASVIPVVEKAVGVTRCLNYPGPNTTTLDAYIHQKNESGLAVDPVLALHQKAGAEIIRPVPNYRPADKANLGHGVLVCYTLNERKPVIKPKSPSAQKPKQKLSVDLYEVEWSISANVQQKKLPIDGVWVILGDEKNGLDLREKLKKERQCPILVQRGQRYKQHSSESFVLNPEDPTHFEQLFKDISNLSKIQGVLYLCDGQHFSNEENFLEELCDFHKQSILGLMHLANSLTTLELGIKTKVWVIARTIVTDGSLQSIAEWPMAAVCKVIQEEYTDLECSYLAADDNQAVLQELMSEPDAESIIAYKCGTRLAPRFVASLYQGGAVPQFEVEATYVIAGAFSPLGIALIQWYASCGAKHLLLIDDRDPSPHVLEMLEEEQKKGLHVIMRTSNFQSEADIKKTLDGDFPPIKGVIHAIAIVDDELIRQLDWNRMWPIYCPRVAGSWNLHRILSGYELDHFLLFSSVITEFAPIGKCSSAVACYFLDALAHYRKIQGQKALSIDWGTWATKNVEVRHLLETRQLKERLKVIPIELALDALSRIMYFSKPEIAACTVDWKKVLAAEGREMPLFKTIR